MEEESLKLKRDYMRYLRLQRSMSTNTLEAYGRDADRLLAYLHGEGIRPEEATLSDLQTFAATLHEVGIGPRSQAPGGLHRPVEA